MYFIVTTYRNKTGNVCCDCVRYYRNDLCWIRVRIVTLNGNKIRWRSYVTYATKLQNDLWLTIVTKIQLYKIVVVIIIYWYRAVREHCSLTALYQKAGCQRVKRTREREPGRTRTYSPVDHRFHPIIVSRVDFMRIPGRRKTILGHIIPRWVDNKQRAGELRRKWRRNAVKVKNQCFGTLRGTRAAGTSRLSYSHTRLAIWESILVIYGLSCEVACHQSSKWWWERRSPMSAASAGCARRRRAANRDLQ